VPDWHLRARGVALAEHAGIAVEIKPLPPQMVGGLRKCAERQIRLPALEPVFELSRIQRHRAHADIRRNRRNARDQRRQKPDHADIRQQQAEHPVRTGGIEFGRRGTQAIGGGEKNTQPIGDVERLGRGLHRLAVTHEQRIGKLRAQAPEHLADRRLRRLHRLSGAGDTALSQQCIENAQLAQAQFRICLLIHIHHSDFGMA
jgi:hypothetical protein